MGRNETATFGRVTPDNQRFARAPRRAEREKAREAWLIPPRARDVERSDDIPIREQEKVKQSVTNPPAIKCYNHGIKEKPCQAPSFRRVPDTVLICLRSIRKITPSHRCGIIAESL